MKKIRVRKCRCRMRSKFFNPSFRWRLGSHDWLFLMHLQTWVEWAKSLQISSPSERRLPPLSTATTTLTFLSPMSSSSAQHAAIIIRSTLSLSVGRISSSNTMKAKSVWAKNGTYSLDWQKKLLTSKLEFDLLHWQAGHQNSKTILLSLPWKNNSWTAA